MSALRCEGIGVALGGRSVLRGVSATFEPGWTAVIGPNGAGKSTLLRVLAGLLPPAHGTVWLGTRPLAAHAPAERARQMAWLAQSGEASGELTVRETVALGRLPHVGLLGTIGSDDERAIAAAMAATECTAWAERRLSALSGGERQRVWLARALATEAPVLLLDEPTAHLDVPHQVALARLLRTEARTRTAVAIVHDLTLALAADAVLLLDAGQVRAHAPASDAELHRAIEATFGHAVRIVRHEGAWVALAALPM